MDEVHYQCLCLASQSPRRAQLLDQIGVEYEVRPANVDESVKSNEMALEYVERITLAKAQSIWSSQEYHRDYPVLASDTAVVVDGKILGKPENREHGLAMLGLLSGRKHQVLTGVGLVMGERSDYIANISDVQFRPLTEQDKSRYWATGEGLDKAGCYAIQGYAATFIESITGSFSGVMGLPLNETATLLERWNIAYWPSRVRQST